MTNKPDLNNVIYKMKWAWRDAQAEGADGDESMRVAVRVMLEALHNANDPYGSDPWAIQSFLNTFAKENDL